MVGERPLTPLRLSVEGLDALGRRLRGRPARSLTRLYRRARSGNCADTALDTSVKRVWQLEAGRIRFDSPEKGTTVELIVEEMRRNVALKSQRPKPRPHDVLVYERACVFLPHRAINTSVGVLRT